mmetsp:Transcript_13071/g.29653  ORF Transcript_13071/g.29653 Transcript_13071/m.29653 type:complete len:293 (-) Transcript_13071:13-891(-)
MIWGVSLGGFFRVLSLLFSLLFFLLMFCPLLLLQLLLSFLFFLAFLIGSQKDGSANGTFLFAHQPVDHAVVVKGMLAFLHIRLGHAIARLKGFHTNGTRCRYALVFLVGNGSFNVLGYSCCSLVVFIVVPLTITEVDQIPVQKIRSRLDPLLSAPPFRFDFFRRLRGGWLLCLGQFARLQFEGQTTVAHFPRTDPRRHAPDGIVSQIILVVTVVTAIRTTLGGITTTTNPTKGQAQYHGAVNGKVGAVAVVSRVAHLLLSPEEILLLFVVRVVSQKPCVNSFCDDQTTILQY